MLLSLIDTVFMVLSDTISWNDAVLMILSVSYTVCIILPKSDTVRVILSQVIQ